MPTDDDRDNMVIDRHLARDARLLRRSRRSCSRSAAGCQAMDVHLVRTFIRTMRDLRTEFIEAQAGACGRGGQRDEVRD